MGNSFVASNGLEKAWGVSGRHPLNGRQFTTIAGGEDSWECKAECSPTCFKSTFDSGEVTWLCPMTGAISADGNSIEFRGNGSTTIFRRER